MAEKSTISATASMPDSVPRTSRQENAKKIVTEYICLSGGIGLIPLPFFDQLSIGALQAKMIYDLGQLYQVETAKYRVKAIVAAILGGAHSGWISRTIIGYLALLAPGISVVSTLFIRPTIAGTVTYVIGNIFIRHFESGRTLEEIDLIQARKDFTEQLKTPSAQDVTTTPDTLNIG